MDAISFVLGEKTQNLRVRNLKVSLFDSHCSHMYSDVSQRSCSKNQSNLCMYQGYSCSMCISVVCMSAFMCVLCII